MISLKGQRFIEKLESRGDHEAAARLRKQLSGARATAGAMSLDEAEAVLRKAEADTAAAPGNPARDEYGRRLDGMIYTDDDLNAESNYSRRMRGLSPIPPTPPAPKWDSTDGVIRTEADFEAAVHEAKGRLGL